MVDDLVAGTVVGVAEDFFGESESDGVAEALAEGACGRFNSGR